MSLEELTRTIEIVDGRTVYRQVLSDQQTAGRRPTNSSPRVVDSVGQERASFERTAAQGLDIKAEAHRRNPELADPARQAQARAELDAYVAGHHLKELRKAIGKTQAEVAQILGVSQSRVSQIENGDLEAMELHPASTPPHSADTWTSPSASASTPSRSLESPDG